MRFLPVALALATPLVVGAAVWGLGRAAGDAEPPPAPSSGPRFEVVDPPPAEAPAPVAPGRLAALRAAWPDAGIVRCPLEGRLRFSVMPLHVLLDQPGEPPPFDYAVVDDTLVLAVPPGAGAANLVTGDGAGLGRLGWTGVEAGKEASCATFRWSEGPLKVPGEVRGAVQGGSAVRACGEGGTLFPVDERGRFTLVLTRSAEPCRLRLERAGRAGPWGEVRADRLDGTMRLDPLPGR